MHFIYCRFINASISDNLSLQAKMNRLKWKWGCERSGAKCPHVRKAQLRHFERLFFSSSWARWCYFAWSTATHSFNFMFFLRFFLLSALLVHFPLFCCCIELNPHTDTQQRATRVPLFLHHFNTFGSAHGNQRKRHASTLIADKFIDSANMPMQTQNKNYRTNLSSFSKRLHSITNTLLLSPSLTLIFNIASTLDVPVGKQKCH